MKHNISKKLAKNIYSIEIILPDSPLKLLHSYVIKANNGKSLVIDTGFNRPECKEAMIKGLEELGLAIEDTSLLLTHLHADHTGLAPLFKEHGCDVYAGKIDGDLINYFALKENWHTILDQRLLFGLGDKEVTLEQYPGYTFGLTETIDFIYLKEGDSLKVGGYNFEVMLLPGHTPGHIALYDKGEKIMFGGDLVLDPITPNITFWGFEYGNILQTYIDSLHRIHSLDINLIYPAHRKTIKNYRERIDELIHHHHIRNQEILEALDDSSLTVSQVSSKISWRVKSKDWESFPPEQKWFATGETMAHLEYLRDYGIVDYKDDEGTLYYYRTGKEYKY